MKQPLKNTLAVAGGDALSRFLGFLATAYLARVLGASTFGLMSIGMSVLSYAMLFASPGLHVLGIREVATHGNSLESLTGSIMSFRLVLASLFLLVTTIFVLFAFSSSSDWQPVLFFTCSVVPMSLSLDWYFQGKERMVVVSTSKVIMYLVYIALVYLLVVDSRGITWAAIAYFIANLTSVVWLMARFRGQGGVVKLAGSVSSWPGLLKKSLPLGLSSLLSQTIVNLPVLLVGMLVSVSATGFFNASMKLVFFLLMIDRVFYVVYFPAITRYRYGGEEQFRRLVSLGLKMVVFLSIPVVLLGIGFAGTVVRTIYSSEYLAAVPVLQWLLPFVVFTVINTVLMCVYLSDNREMEYVKLLAVGTLILILLCFLFSLVWGVTGTAMGLSIGEALMMILSISRLQKAVSINAAKILWPMVAAGFAMAGSLYVLHDSPLPVAVSVPCLFFVIVAFSLGGFKRGDLLFLKERFV